MRGFTMVEVMVVIAVIAVVLLMIVNVAFNNRGATEKRSYESAQNFIENNELEVYRITCAGDSNDDGYGSCAITLKNKERIRLECPCDFWAVNIWGAGSCKEVFNDIQLGQ